MTTTISVIRTAIDPQARGTAVTLDPRSSPTENFFTIGTNVTVTLATPPSGVGVDTTDYDGQRFRVVRAGGSGTFTVNYGSATKILAVGQWAEFVFTGSPTSTLAIWRLAGFGSL